MGAGNRSESKSVLREIFSFPEIVNDYAARTVAGFIFTLALFYIQTQNIYILMFMTYGFLARVITGPSLSPLALLVTKIIIPKIGNPQLDCPGPPKRFAQTIGLVFTGTSLYLVLNGNPLIALYLIGILAVFALLESMLGFCAGCFVFKQMMALGLIPQEICDRCNNILLKDSA